jgi:hypothetical protein
MPELQFLLNAWTLFSLVGTQSVEWEYHLRRLVFDTLNLNACRALERKNTATWRWVWVGTGTYHDRDVSSWYPHPCTRFVFPYCPGTDTSCQKTTHIFNQQSDYLLLWRILIRRQAAVLLWTGIIKIETRKLRQNPFVGVPTVKPVTSIPIPKILGAKWDPYSLQLL